MAHRIEKKRPPKPCPSCNGTRFVYNATRTAMIVCPVCRIGGRIIKKGG